MNISYEPLESGPAGFRDGLQWAEEMQVWAEAYEARCMVPNNDNHAVAEMTTEYLLDAAPDFLKPVGRHVISTLMGNRLRKAMM